MEFTMKAVNDGASKRPSLRAVIEDPEYTSDNAIEWIEVSNENNYDDNMTARM